MPGVCRQGSAHLPVPAFLAGRARGRGRERGSGAGAPGSGGGGGSLGARDGFSRNLSLLVWLRHVLEAEAGSRSLRRSVLQYGDLLADWRRAQARLANDLADAWPSVAEIDANGIDRFLRRDPPASRCSAGVQRGPVNAEGLGRSRHGRPCRDQRRRPGAGRARIVPTGRRARSSIRQWTCSAWTRRRRGSPSRKRPFDSRRRRAAWAADLQNLNVELAGLSPEERAELQGENARIREAAEGLKVERAVLQRHISDLLAEREAVLSSMSWRLTAPLRTVAGALLKRD